jgi:hypothetical protein
MGFSWPRHYPKSSKRAYKEVIGGKLNRLCRQETCVSPPDPIEKENEKDETRDLEGNDRNARDCVDRSFSREVSAGGN